MWDWKKMCIRDRNKAELQYILKTETEIRKDSDTASVTFEMRKQPGILSLSKWIINPDDHATFKYYDPGEKPVHGMSAEQFRKTFSGYVQFEITKVSDDPEQNGKPAVIYTAVPDENGIYHRADDKYLVINPFKDSSDPADMAVTSADGIVKVALDCLLYTSFQMWRNMRKRNFLLLKKRYWAFM